MRCLLLTGFAVAAVAPSARADVREDAREEFAAGQAADARSDWGGAIEHYLRANDLVPHPFSVYNIAVDYERLGKLREAAIWYARYLQLAPTSEDRNRVASQLAELQARPGTLAVSSIPPGARVVIDGRDAGTAPLAQEVASGGHRVRVQWGEVTAVRDVALEYGEPVEVTLSQPVTLEPARPKGPGSGWLYSTAGGADLGGAGAFLMTGIGIRLYGVDAIVRAGENQNSFSMFDILTRVAFSKRQLAPFASAGYAYGDGANGVVVSGGLRWDVVRSWLGVVLIAETGLRYYRGQMGATMVPVMLSVEGFLRTAD
jgi:hypothetical protein